MTVLVGINCSDGVVIGADGSATFAQGRRPTVEQPTEKLRIIDDRVILASTGSIGQDQRFAEILEAEWKANLFRGKSPTQGCLELSRKGLVNFEYTAVDLKNVEYGCLLAFPYKHETCLFEFSSDRFQPEQKDHRIWYVSMGSGQPIVDPFLALMREVFWKEGPPTHRDATFAVVWALQHAVRTNPGGINEPIQVAVLSKESGDMRARLLDEDTLQEHRQNVAGAEEHLAKYADILRGDADAEPPPEPPDNT